MNLEQLTAALRSQRLTVAVAESATGGLISAELSRLPDSSAFFKGGIVAYDNYSKTEILRIPVETVLQHGSVSAETCLAMARSARALFDADVGLGETSVAGPGGGTEQKPVGLSYVAVSGDRGEEARQHTFQGSRDDNRQRAVVAALELLSAYVGDGLTEPKVP